MASSSQAERQTNTSQSQTDPTPSPKSHKAFKKAWGIDAPTDDDLRKAFTVGVTEWHRRHAQSDNTKLTFFAAQIIAPVAAGTATVLAATGISAWAVIPSAIATVTASLLASFGLRENWKALRLTTRQFGFEIANFAEGWGTRYRNKPKQERIDLFMERIEALSIHSILDGKPSSSIPDEKPGSGFPPRDDAQTGGTSS